jgi:hypothetical protein
LNAAETINPTVTLSERTPMPTCLMEADAALKARVLAIARRFHPETMMLEPDVRILIASNPDGDAIKLHGYPCHATIKKTSLEDRAAGKGDVILKLDEATVNSFSATEFEALIDHEFTHLVPACHSVKHKNSALAGKPKRDDLGRPVFKIRLHDMVVGGFQEVAVRHKDDTIEVQTMKLLGGQGVQSGWLRGF